CLCIAKWILWKPYKCQNRSRQLLFLDRNSAGSRNYWRTNIPSSHDENSLGNSAKTECKTVDENHCGSRTGTKFCRRKISCYYRNPARTHENALDEYFESIQCYTRGKRERSGLFFCQTHNSHLS